MRNAALCKRIAAGLLTALMLPGMVGCLPEGDSPDGSETSRGAATNETGAEDDGGWDTDGAGDDLGGDLGDGIDTTDCEAVYSVLGDIDDEAAFDGFVADFPECFEGDHGIEISVCDGILDDLNYLPPEYHQAVWDAYDQCLIAEQGDHIPEPELICEPILDGLEYAQTQEEADQIIADFDACMSTCPGDLEEPVHDQCEIILEDLAYAPPEYHDEIIDAFEACVDQVEPGDPWGDGYEDPALVCDVILEDLQWAFTEAEIDAVFQAHTDCLESLSPADPGYPDGDVCEPILDGLEFAQTQEEVDQIFADYDACTTSIHDDQGGDVVVCDENGNCWTDDGQGGDHGDIVCDENGNCWTDDGGFDGDDGFGDDGVVCDDYGNCWTDGDYGQGGDDAQADGCDAILDLLDVLPPEEHGVVIAAHAACVGA